ncbi:MAG TPA: ornithine cyclodeaminase [Oligoflexia bacterium]|nr:ornithine cyclodeaminase [Oligoflexia bacterium]HMP47916.1 ornithine cyclodeaminase [Oligoflexia bacterium]
MRNGKTLYLDVNDIRLIVARFGLSELIGELVEFIRFDFSEWDKFQKTPRTANHILTGVIELMPVSNPAHFAFKYVNGHPGNPAKGLPTIMAFGAYSDMSNGFPLLISEMTILTAIRTAATSVLAARYMARSNSRTMALIGNGAQAEFQIIAFSELMGVNKIRLFDVDLNATKKVLTNLSERKGLKFFESNNTSDAVREMDIITTCTADKKRAKILTDQMVEAGQHINALGGDCPGKTELESNILLRSNVVVEYEEQSRIEGEVQQMPLTFTVTELHEIVNGIKPGRSSDNEITVFDSVGFALEDYSVLRFIYDKALSIGAGSYINIIPEMNDVKNLFGVLN